MKLLKWDQGLVSGGGEIIYQGNLKGLKHSQAKTSLNHRIQINKNPRKIERYFTVKNAKDNNLKNISINIPKNVLVAICGVSGSGKSSLMFDAFEKIPQKLLWLIKEVLEFLAGQH